MEQPPDDPLMFAGLDKNAVEAATKERDTAGKSKKTSELELAKEARLAEKEKRLATQRAPAPAKGANPPVAPPTTPSNPTPPGVEEKSIMLDKIYAYRERFPHVKKRNSVTAKSTIDEIGDELHYIEVQLGSAKQKMNFGAVVLVASMHGLETITRDFYNPLNLNLTGLGNVTQQNMAEFEPIIDELMIKYGASYYTSPEWRLALALGATVVTVNAANRDPAMARAMKNMHERATPPKNAADL